MQTEVLSKRDVAATAAIAPLLSVRNIEVVYDDVILVLRGLSMEVPKGAIVALLGANGAGKSTTLKAISGLLKTEDGEVTRGEIVFFDAPEPVLVLRRDLEGESGILAMFNLGNAPVSFTLPQAAGAVAMSGHGLPGSVDGTSVSLPAYGAWFGSIAA